MRMKHPSSGIRKKPNPASFLIVTDSLLNRVSILIITLLLGIAGFVMFASTMLWIYYWLSGSPHVLPPVDLLEIFLTFLWVSVRFFVSSFLILISAATWWTQIVHWVAAPKQ